MGYKFDINELEDFEAVAFLEIGSEYSNQMSKEFKGKK